MEAQKGMTVWEKLAVRVAPSPDGREVAAMSDAEVKAFAKSAEIATATLRPLVQAERLSAQTGIGPAMFFALIKADMGRDLGSLLAHTNVELREALVSAIDRHVIPEDVGAQIDDGIARFEALRYRHGSLQSAASGIKVKLPAKLTEFLVTHGIETLEDIRRGGGLSELKGLPVSPADPKLRALEAAAQFTMLSDDPAVGKALLNADFSGLVEVARTSSAEFRRRVEKDLPAPQAAAVHEAAEEQALLVNNYVTGLRVLGAANPARIPLSLAKHLPLTCHCCSDAASPAAYLADLLDYTVRHVRHNGAAVDLAFLEGHLHQPFAGLPIVCEDDVESIRQVRICIEVLRDMLPSPQKTDAPQGYLEGVYRRLLERSGTSFDEVRGARVAKTDDRNKLARRLQVLIDPNPPFPRPTDDLDLLFQDPDGSTLTEEWLEEWFGLRSTARPPLDPPLTITASRLLKMRLNYWHEQWRIADSSDATAPIGAWPLIDPDIVGHVDLADASSVSHSPTPADKTTWTALDFLDHRINWINSAVGALNGYRKPSGLPPRSFSQMLIAFGGANTLPGVATAVTSQLYEPNNPANDPLITLRPLLAQLRLKQRGLDISGWIAQRQLSVEEFDLLSQMAALQAQNLPITESEWTKFNSVVVQLAKKRELAAQWLIEERAVRPNAAVPRASQITLTRKHFRLRPVSDAASAWMPVAFRSDPATRRRWESALRSRLDQEQSLQEATRSAVDAVEKEMLVLLRDALLITAASTGNLGAGPGLLTPNRKKWFTNNLLIDGETAACAVTTRIEQAIETVQGLLFGIRNGLLDDTRYDIDDPAFDEIWQWLGSYDAWRAAMNVFLYPENVLRPTLRTTGSQVFDDLVTELRGKARNVSPEDAGGVAGKYSAYFRDVCSLSLVALGQSSGAQYFELPATSASQSAPYYLLVARGGHTGRLYYCVQDVFPGWWLTSGFRRSPWNPIPGLEPSHRITSILPYQLLDGSREIGLCATDPTAGDPNVFLTFNGSGWANQRTERPLLFNSCPRYDAVPVSTGLAQAGAAPWTIRNSDHLACLDIDGDGRKEIVIVARALNSDGTRSVGAVREREGGLELSLVARIAGDWELPGGQSVVLRTTLTQSPSRRREQLLLVNRAGGNVRLGLLGRVNATIGLVHVTTAGAITRPGGAGSWTIKANARFVAADIDGDGYSELIAIDPTRTSTSPSPGGYSVNYYQDISVLDVRETGFTWRSWQSHGPVNSVVAMNDSQSRGQVLLCVSAMTSHPEIADASVLRWNPAVNALVESSDRLAWILPNVPKPQGFDDPNAISASSWQFHRDDRWLVGNLDAAKTGDELLVTNDAAADTLTLALGGPAPVSVPAPGSSNTSPARVSQFGITWRTAGRIDPQDGTAALTWARKPGDRFVAADIDGDGRQEIVVVSPDARDIGVLARSALGTVKVLWTGKGGVPHAAENSEPGWQATTDCTLVVGDIDGDGNEELVARENGRLTILRGYPLINTADAKTSPGVYGVRWFDVAPTGDAGWPPSRKTQIENAYNINTNPDAPGLLYLDEAYYFLPVEISLRLYESGNYKSALDWIRSIYDYEKPPSDRAVVYKLTQQQGTAISKMTDWLRDPMNPHAIAATRDFSYLKYTILVTVRCLLGYADSEFTYGTPESINLARELYLKALELLGLPEITARGPCDDLIGTLETTIGEGEWIWPEVKQLAMHITDRNVLARTVDHVRAIMKSSKPAEARREAILSEMRVAQEGNEQRTLESVMLVANKISLKLADAALAALPAPHAPPLGESHQESGGFPGAPIASIGRVPRRAGVSQQSNRSNPPNRRPPTFVPAPSPVWCIRPNAQFDALRRHAELNLHKLRNCRNIAGLEVVFRAEPGGSASQLDLTDVQSLGQLRAVVQRRLPPLPYRYVTLIERAKQLVELARQIEQSMLASLQAEDQKRYELLKARQDLALARAGVRLRDLQAMQAGDATHSAELQRDRAQMQVAEYDRRLQAGLTANEQASLTFQFVAAAMHASAGVAAFANWVGDVSGVSYKESISALAQAASASGGAFGALAGYERRTEDWQFQARLGRQEVLIGMQQARVAQDQEQVAGQERVIAGLQSDHAATILDFLSTGAFGTLALYEWMSGVLEGIYRFFLQQATSLAKMAEDQLAFERQQNPPTVIRGDYWIPPETGMSTGSTPGPGQAPDVKGLTGSARLMQDIYALDQYAFTTNQRKLQLTETISLARLDPIAFQRFRQTGNLVFETPMNLFDRKFPGHYLRLIRRVRMSVIALIPESVGIRATLGNSGLSYVVIGPDLFQTATIRRPPETVALSSARNATGLFELDIQPELLVPFEGFGVDTRWQFEMPRPANPFDYGSIADVMFTLEYTALNSYDYRQQVLQNLSPDVAADRAFSFRNDFADAWYELNNPDVCAPPAMSVGFSVASSDFPPNLDPSSLAMTHIAVLFAFEGGSATQVAVRDLSLTPPGGAAIAGGSANSDPTTGILSTRLGNAGTWSTLIQQAPNSAPFGNWKLALTDSAALRRLFADGKIKDILFALSYRARMPQWPL